MLLDILSAQQEEDLIREKAIKYANFIHLIFKSEISESKISTCSFADLERKSAIRRPTTVIDRIEA